MPLNWTFFSHKNSRTFLLWGWIAFLFSGVACPPSLAGQAKLNILWINADDLGRELSCYGHPLVQTPNIDRLAEQGVRYTKAYANTPVCSPSRSSLITGFYPTSINCQDHRTLKMTELPDGIKPITEYFKNAGYFISNGSGLDMKKPGKRDYNFVPDIHYDGSDWSQRAKGQPFFAQVQIKYPHRSFVTSTSHPIDPEEVVLPGCYLDHPLLKADWARYLESVQACDSIVGRILNRLEGEGLADNTVVFFFGDHGRPHLRDKQFLYEGGLQIPLIVRWPGQLKPGKTDPRLVSLVDVAATTMRIADLEPDSPLHGKIFLGPEQEKREFVFGFRQRAGDAPDAIRSITDGRYKLIWNQEPQRPWMQLSSYKRSEYPAFTLYRILHAKGELPPPYDQLMAPTRPEFELYDLKKDPEEFQNLADNPRYTKHFESLQKTLLAKLKDYDQSVIIESAATIQQAKNGSARYLQKKMQERGLPSEISDQALLDYWYELLLGGD